jgi:hypothetical protein
MKMNRLTHSQHDEMSGQKVFSIQKIITVAALLLLLIAVQVSTQNASDWFVFGLNVLEVTAPLHVSVNEVVNVSTDFVSGLHQLSDIIWTLVTAFIEFIFR